MTNSNLAAFQTVNGIAAVKNAADANYQTVPGDGTVRFPEDPAQNTEVVSRRGITNISGHVRLGTFELTLPSLLPHHPAVELMRAARLASSVVNFSFTIPARDLGTVAGAGYNGANSKVVNIHDGTGKQSAVDAIVAPGMVFADGASGLQVVDTLTYSGGKLTAINVTNQITAAVVKGSAYALAFKMPKLVRAGIQCNVESFAEGEADAEGTLTGRVVFRLLSEMPAWVASLT